MNDDTQTIHPQFAELSRGITRRHFFSKTSGGIGAAALAHVLGADSALSAAGKPKHGGVLDGLHFPAKVKRVIYLFMSGGPSQIETVGLTSLSCASATATNCPPRCGQGQRLTTMSGNQASLPLAGSIFKLRAARLLRHLGQRTLAAHRESRR